MSAVLKLASQSTQKYVQNFFKKVLCVLFGDLPEELQSTFGQI